MKVFLNNVSIFLQSIFIFLFEILKFYLNITKKEECIVNIFDKLSNLNMIYTKVLQWVINDTIYNNSNLMNYFEKFTNKVKYDESEIDYESLLELKNQNIILDSNVPINSGTLSLVFKGKYDKKDVVVKILKKNIKVKLIDSVLYFKFLCCIIDNIPFFSNYNISKIISDNFDNLIKQTDFLTEIDNTNIFYESFTFIYL